MGFKVKDHYYKKAQEAGFQARSVYKLKEMDARFRIFNKEDKVLDLGCCPGSWTQYASKKVGPKGQVVGVDRSPVKSVSYGHHVTFFQKDVFSLENLLQLDLVERMDILLSDMAPSMTGIKCVDQVRSLELAEKTFGLMKIFLERTGRAVVKAFDCNDVQVFLKDQRKCFDRFHYVRPKATRSSSSEFFVVGLGYKG